MPFWCRLGVKLLNPLPQSRDRWESPPGSRPDVIARARIEPDGSPAAIARCAMRVGAIGQRCGRSLPSRPAAARCNRLRWSSTLFRPFGCSPPRPASLAVRSANTPERQPCWMACPRQAGCWATGAMTPIGSATPLKRRELPHASLAENPGTSPSNTTSVDTKAATGSRSCSVVSKTGGASQHATTDARPSSYPPSHSPPPSGSGYES